VQVGIVEKKEWNPIVPKETEKAAAREKPRPTIRSSRPGRIRAFWVQCLLSGPGG
jgi:hypothetical protein